MNPALRLLLSVLITLAVGGCGGEPSSNEETGQPLIVDGAHHNGTPGFFFLPPLVPATTYGKTFSAGLSPVVLIDELGGRGTIATFTKTSGLGNTRVMESSGFYYVVWQTNLSKLNPSLIYRVHVQLKGVELGLIDLKVVVSVGGLLDFYRTGQSKEYAPVFRGLALLIPFRIEPAALKCVGVVCAPLDQCHVAGVCDSHTGACSNPAKPNGTACNDSNACTPTDTCQAGICTGLNPVVCSALDQCHDVGVCNTTTGVCSNPKKTDGTGCNDGNACTQTDICQAGICTGSNPVVCSALDQCHDTGTCDPATGQCSNPNKTDGTACNDGNACTQTDSCQAGVCVGSNPVVCSALDQCHGVGVCNSTTGVCSNPSKADGTGCNDDDLCTQTDTCQAGICTGTNPVVCSALDQCHDTGTCDPGTGQCSIPNKTDGTACNDGNACTQPDICKGGTCVGANPVNCPASDVCHVAGTCDPNSGGCTNPELNCDDGDTCTADSCVLPTSDFAGGCVHLRSTGPNCAETCVYDPETNTTACTPTSYDDVVILDSFMAGDSFHANQDVKISVTIQAGAAHDAFPIKVTLFRVTDPSSDEIVVGTLIATAAISIADAGKEEYWIDGHIPVDIAPGIYELFVNRYPDGELVGSATQGVSYNITASDPGLPVLDLSDYFPGQQVLLVDSSSTVDPEDLTAYRDTSFGGTIEIVARNYPVTQVPLTAYLSWNGGDIPLQFWDPAQHQYVAELIVGGTDNELEPEVPRSQYIEVAVSENDAQALRSQLEAGPVSTQIVFAVNANRSVNEATCPSETVPSICNHTLSVSTVVAEAPLPAENPLAASASSIVPQAVIKSTVMLAASTTSSIPLLRFEKNFSRVVEDKYLGYGVKFGGWIQLSEAGLDAKAYADYPVKMFGKWLHLLTMVVNLSANRNKVAHIDYTLIQAGLIIYADTTPFIVDASTIIQKLPFPSYNPTWKDKFPFRIYIVDVTPTAKVTFNIGLDPNVVIKPGSLSLVATPHADATGSVILNGDIVGAEGTINLVNATVNCDLHGTYEIHDDPELAGHQYLLGNVNEKVHYEIDSLNGSISLWAKWFDCDTCHKHVPIIGKVSYPCHCGWKKHTLPICSWTGYHSGNDLINASQSGQINLRYAYPANYCSIPVDGAQRCGVLPPDDFGNTPDCGSCPTGYECSKSENLCYLTSCMVNCVTEFAIPTANSNPFRITAGPDGNLWFTETTASKIGRITPSGSITEFPISTTNKSPKGIAAGPDDSLWFTGGLEIGRITTNGDITDFPISTANSGLDGIVAGPDGSLWFTEDLFNSIGRINTDGGITEFVVPSADSHPYGIASGPDGNLWFTEYNANKIGRVTTAGSFKEFAIPTAGSWPYSITVGPDGNLWFTEYIAGKIGRITTAGVITEFPLPTVSSMPTGITAGPDGNLWFAEYNVNKIGRITPGGSIAEIDIPTPNSGPVGIAASPDGKLWFTEYANNIGRISP